MSVTSGFFNALNHDRRYDALTVSRLFDGMIADGVYSTIGDKFLVTADTGLTVLVGSGRAWFNHTWTYNDTELPLTFEDSETLLYRTDMIVLEVDHGEDVRENFIKIIKGTPASTAKIKPEYIRSEFVNQYPIAYVTIRPGTQEILQSDIENAVGTDVCPFANALLEHVSTSELIREWEAQWNEYIKNKMDGLDAWEIEYVNRINNWMAGLRDILEDDAAGHLQNQIDGLGNIIAYTEYVDEEDKETVKATKQYSYGDCVVVNYGNSISPKLYYVIDSVSVGIELREGVNMVSDRVWDRINKIYETNLFRIHEYKWSLDTITKWGKILYYYDLRFNDIYLPPKHVPDIRSCGATIDSPATDIQEGQFSNLVSKADIDRKNKKIRLYSDMRLKDFYICVNGIKGDIDGGITYDKTTLTGIRRIIQSNDPGVLSLINIGDTIKLIATANDDTLYFGKEDPSDVVGEYMELGLVSSSTAKTFTVEYTIIDINYRDNQITSGKNVVFGATNSFEFTRPMHGSNDNTVKFSNTAICGYLVKYFNALSSSDRNAIATRSFVRGDGGKNITTTHVDTARIWVPSAVEILGASSFSNANEVSAGTQFAYYADSANNRIKKSAGAAKAYWTRSPYKSNATQGVVITTAGAQAGSAYNLTASYGICPHFMITA